MTLFERTKETAKKRGINLQKTAELAGLSANAIYRWKTTNPSKVSIDAVANVLNVPSDYLLGKTDSTENVSSNTLAMDEALEDDELLLSFQGKEVTPEYRDAILAILRTMPDRDENGKEI